MKKLRLTLMTALVVSISIFHAHHNALAEIRTIKINVPACRCADTWAMLRITVQRIDGVKAVLANPLNQSAIITFDDEKTNFEQMNETLVRERVYVVGQPEYLK
jgi:hypothetical protein